MWTIAFRRIPRPPAYVLAAATEPGRWPNWLRFATASGEHLLDTPGAWALGTIESLWSAREVEWHVIRRRFDTVLLEARTREGAPVAELRISCSWWHGECGIELQLDLTRRTLAPGWLWQLRLRRALARLEALLVPKGASTATVNSRAPHVRPQPRSSARARPTT